MRVSFVFNLNLNVLDTDEAYKGFFNNDLVPLINLFKSKKNLCFSLCINAFLLDKLEALGYGSVLADIAMLVKADRLELIGSPAYNCLTNLKDTLCNPDSLVFNEYALGYYFGRKSGFEGDSAILIKDLYGAINVNYHLDATLISILDSLHYTYTISKPVNTINEAGFFYLETTKLKIITPVTLTALNQLPLELNIADEKVFIVDYSYFDKFKSEAIFNIENYIDAFEKAEFDFEFCFKIIKHSVINKADLNTLYSEHLIKNLSNVYLALANELYNLKVTDLTQFDSIPDQETAPYFNKHFINKIGDEKLKTALLKTFYKNFFYSNSIFESLDTLYDPVLCKHSFLNLTNYFNNIVTPYLSLFDKNVSNPLAKDLFKLLEQCKDVYTQSLNKKIEVSTTVPNGDNVNSSHEAVVSLF